MESNTVETAREQWLAARSEGLGASDSGALFGHWGSPLQLYSRVLKLIPPQPANEKMDWGNRLEPLVRQHYGRESGRLVVTAADAVHAMAKQSTGEIAHLLNLLKEHCEVAYGPDADGTVILRSKARPWQMFTPDGFVLDDKLGWGTLQIKCTAWEEPWSDGLPEHHVPQALHEQAVAGLAWTSFGVLFSGNRFDWLDYQGTDDARAEVNATEAAFWAEHVLKGVQPEADGSKATADALKKLYPDDNGETFALPADALAWDEEYVQAKAEKKAAELRMKAAETRLKASIAANTWGELPNGQRFSLKTTVSEVAKFALKRPELEAVLDGLDLLAKDKPDAVFLKTKLVEKLEAMPSKWRTLRRLKAVKS